MRKHIYIIAGIMFCLGSINAAEPTPTPAEAVQNSKSKEQKARNARAPAGKLYLATDTGVYVSVKDDDNQGAVATGGSEKKNLSSGGANKGHSTGALRNVASDSGVYVSRKSRSKGNVATGDAKKTGRQSAAQTGTDAQGRLLVGTDGGVWRGANNHPNQTGVTVGDTNAPSRRTGAHSGSQGKLIVGVDDGKKATPAGATHSSGKKAKKGETSETRKDKSMTMKGKKILQN